MRLEKFVCVLFAVLAVGSTTLRAQTSTSATLLGTVRDNSDAVVTGAQVTLRNVATNATRGEKTNAEGYYTFLHVDPGAYTLTVEMTGFQKATLSGLNFDVTKSYTVDVPLRVGAPDQIVFVSTEAAIELQTTDATIGNVIAGSELMNLPTLRRSAQELLSLQPGATPGSAQGDTAGESGGGVSGARADQNAIALDGIDITNVFNPGDSGLTGSTIVPMNVDALSEFRVGVSNPNASVASAAGGQVSVASKGGSNSFHGSVYYYIQNTAFNANSWENNHTQATDLVGNPIPGKFVPRATIHDNRGGFTFGGPIRRDKTFFFMNYEPRRFITTTGGSGNTPFYVPSLDFRNGIIHFTNPVTGLPTVACIMNNAQYSANVAAAQAACAGTGASLQNGSTGPTAGYISQNCGASASTSCDPRGLGMSPAVAALLGNINTSIVGNNPVLSDGIGCSSSPSCQNVTQFLFNLRTPIRDDDFNVRLDHNFSQNLHFFGRYSWFREIDASTGSQVELTGASPTLFGGTGNRGDAAVAGIDWSIRANLINSFHFGWVRQRDDLTTINEASVANKFKIAGTQDASGNYVDLQDGFAGGNSQPLAFTQPIQEVPNGFTRAKNIQFSDDLNWIKATHTLVFGADVRWVPTYVTGDVAPGTGQGDVSSLRVISDGVGSLGNDIPGGGSNGAADHLYSSMLGLVRHVGYVQNLDSSFQPIPGHPIQDLEANTHALYFYFQDSWRIKPSFTLTYGLSWGVQTPYRENKGRLLALVDGSTNKLVDAPQTLAVIKADALKGINDNPTYGFVPYGKLGMSGMWNTDWSDIAPRASIAWSPSADSGVLGKLLGNKKTVIRTGYAMAYDRLNGGTIPKLFGQPGFAVNPATDFPTCTASGPAIAGCVAGSNDPALNGFRVGWDGAIPVASPQLPSAPSATNPYVPGSASGAVLTMNPNFKQGRNHMIDFSIQRELPGNMIMEVGYIGRLGRRLPGLYPLTVDPYMFTDPASGQSFAQANDCIAQTLRYGAMVNWPVMPKLGSFGCQDSSGNLLNQPWFENQLPIGWGAASTSQGGCGGGSNTACIITQEGGPFGNNFATGGIGANGPPGVFAAINNARCGPLGTNASTLAQFQQCALSNQQITDLQQRRSDDFSNYHALTFTLRNRGWHGLTYDMNYTWSKSLDQGGRTQGFVNGYDDPWNPNAMYGPSYFDRKHVFNAIFNYYLPFGQGHKLSSGSGAVNRFIGGWSMSGVFRADSGLPLVVAQSGFAYGGGLVTTNNVDTIPTGHNFSTGLFHNNGNTASDTATGACATFAGAMGNGSPQIGTASAGTGLNYFSNPATAYCSFRPVLLTVDTRDGRGNPLRGFGMWNLDASIGKETAVGERFKVRFSADFFNFFNHVTFVDPLTSPGITAFIDATKPANFGAISSSFTPAQRPVGSRWIQFGLRVSF